jgi:hypothetical protein
MSLCPICYSESGTWSDDPVLCTPALLGSTAGFTIIKPTHIIEIQNACNLAEIEAGLTPSIWTVINYTNIFQVIKICVKELRTSIENILTANNSDKNHYFNYDKDGNYMGTSQVEWHDVDLDDKLYQIKAIHLEDLRHPIPVPLNCYIIVHGHNPEGKEIGSITGFSGSVAVYDGAITIGVADGINPITILPGHHHISVKFNGMTLAAQEIDIIGGETQHLTFTFNRTVVYDLQQFVLSLPTPLIPNVIYYAEITIPSYTGFIKIYSQTVGHSPVDLWLLSNGYSQDNTLAIWHNDYLRTLDAYVPIHFCNYSYASSDIGGFKNKYSSVPYALEDL